MALTKEQQDTYFSSQSSSATPLSPAQYEASLTPPATNTGAITSDQLQPTTAITPPAPVPAQDASKIDLSGFIKDIQTATAPDPALEASRKSAQSLYDTYLNAGGSKATDRTQGLQGAEYTNAQKEYAPLVSEGQMLKAEQDTLDQRVQQYGQGKDVTRGELAPIQNAQQRDLSIRQRFWAAKYAVAQGNMALAEQHVNQAVEDKYADRTTNINNAKAQLDYLDKQIEQGNVKKTSEVTLALAERTRLLAKQETDLKNEKDDAKSIRALALDAQKNNPNNPAVQMAVNQALKSNDLKTAFSLLGQYQTDPLATKKAILENDYIRAQTDKLNADVRKINIENGNANIPTITNPNASKYTGALQVILGSGKFTKEQKADLINSVNRGEDPLVTLKNQAKNTMGQTEATTVTKYEAAKSSLQDIQQNLKDFYAQGWNTGIFTGNYEKVINNLGSVNDPKLVDLATQIQANLQIYRNAVSGTAYSEQEGADIARIFPGINKSEGLNTAILNGRMKAFDSTIDGTYKSVLGSTYDTIKNAETNQSKGTTTDRDFVAQSVQKSGQTYNDIISKAPAGQIAVVNNQTGEVGYLPAGEFTSTNFTRL